MRSACEQGEGYARTVEIWDSGIKIQLHITEEEARQLVAHIAYGFGNLMTSRHIWGAIEEVVI